jgi:FKBP-type peptidyl-prolyl cis-trans isomerase FklB
MNPRWMVVIGVGLLAAQAGATERRPLRTEKDKVSYAMAVAVAKSIQRQGVDVDVDVFARGLRDALAGRKLLATEDELRAAMSHVVGDLKQKEVEAQKDRKEAGARFLADNAKKEGVVSLASGLQYRILDAGNGRTPTDADAVLCHFSAASVDGKELDSSRRRGKAVTFNVAKAIPGLREALKLMPLGSRWQVFIPPELGYGARGGGRKSRIRPNDTLVYEVQLVAITAATAPMSVSDTTAAVGVAPASPAN